MREILFKAKTMIKKHKNNGFNNVWVEGDLIENQGEYYIHPKANSVNVEGELGKLIVMHEVQPNTVCQYTGLKDKNGNKIWENDIVKCYADTDDLGNDLYFFYKVIWHESYHCWWLSDIHTLEDEYLHQFNPSDIEVIGNIFDNPELLNYVDNDASQQAHQEVLKPAT